MTISDTAQPQSPDGEYHLEYTAIPGYFKQDEEDFDGFSFEWWMHAFGLISRCYDTDGSLTGSPTDWERLRYHIECLNRNAPEGTCHKFFFAARHGQGVHNVAADRYERDAWNNYWSLQDEDERGRRLVDARLTKEGIKQAELVGETWRGEFAKGMPAPGLCIVSPLTRCCQTWMSTFSKLGAEAPKPVIEEGIRETYGAHTCDKRRDRSEIAKEFPAFTIPRGFAEKDHVYERKYRELPAHREKRVLQFLDSLFDPAKQAQPDTINIWTADPDTSAKAQKETFISFTAHAGLLSSLLKVTHHQPFNIRPGSMFPMLVRIKRVPGPRVLGDVGPEFEEVVEKKPAGL